MGTRLVLLGLISQACFYEGEGVVKIRTLPSASILTYKQRTYLKLGVVIKTRAIFATIDEFMKKVPPGKYPVRRRVSRRSTSLLGC